jgi:hypothetical protein
MSETKKKLCQRCKVFPLDYNPAMNAVSHDGKTMICTNCGQIESFEKLDPVRAEGLKVGLRRTQAALYGLDENGDPKLPKDVEEEPELRLRKNALVKGACKVLNGNYRDEKREEEYPPIHAHCAWFGSELACSICNPVCWEKHQMENPNHLNWCGEENCPLNPKRFKDKVEKNAWQREIEPEVEEDAGRIPKFGEVEEVEDEMRRSKRKSLHNCGKYKGRGKEKRREP